MRLLRRPQFHLIPTGHYSLEAALTIRCQHFLSNRRAILVGYCQPDTALHRNIPAHNLGQHGSLVCIRRQTHLCDVRFRSPRQPYRLPDAGRRRVPCRYLFPQRLALIVLRVMHATGHAVLARDQVIRDIELHRQVSGLAFSDALPVDPYLDFPVGRTHVQYHALTRPLRGYLKGPPVPSDGMPGRLAIIVLADLRRAYVHILREVVLAAGYCLSIPCRVRFPGKWHADTPVELSRTLMQPILLAGALRIEPEIPLSVQVNPVLPFYCAPVEVRPRV